MDSKYVGLERDSDKMRHDAMRVFRCQHTHTRTHGHARTRTHTHTHTHTYILYTIVVFQHAPTQASYEHPYLSCLITFGSYSIRIHVRVTPDWRCRSFLEGVHRSSSTQEASRAIVGRRPGPVAIMFVVPTLEAGVRWCRHVRRSSKCLLCHRPAYATSESQPLDPD